MLATEHYLIDKYPQQKKDDFLARSSRPSISPPETANQIVALINAYYRANPDEIRKPVIAIRNRGRYRRFRWLHRGARG